MGKWNNEKYSWIFAPKNPVDLSGSHAQVFRNGKDKDMVRELLQNGVDVKNGNLPDNTPVRIRLEIMEMEASDFPGIEAISDAIESAWKVAEEDRDFATKGIKSMAEANSKYLKNCKKIPVLKYSDYNTTGLTPVNYQGLLKEQGKSSKKGDKAGSQGYGKLAAFKVTPIRTVLYSSKWEEKDPKTGEMKEGYLFQSRALLPQFIKQGVMMNGSSLFGSYNENRTSVEPIRDPEDVPEIFRRTETGTDIYIPCYNKAENWMDRMILTILNNFAVTIDRKKLEVELYDGEDKYIIHSGNIDDMMKKYEEVYFEKYSETSEIDFIMPLYWKVLKNENTDHEAGTKHFTISSRTFKKDMGEVELHLLMNQPDITDRKILEMRSSGMVIREETKCLRGLPSCVGVLIATGKGKENANETENISLFLREMEDASHDSWRKDNIDEDREDLIVMAEYVVKGLERLIREAVKKKVPETDGSPVVPAHLNRFIADRTKPGTDTLEEDAFMEFSPALFMFTPEKGKKFSGNNKVKIRSTNGRGKNTNPTPAPRPNPDPEREKQHRDNHQGKKIWKELPISRVHTPYDNNTGRYCLSFIPGKTAEKVVTDIHITGDEGAFDVLPIGAWMTGEKLKVYGNKIQIPKVVKGEKVSLEFSISEKGQFALEVKAYARNI